MVRCALIHGFVKPGHPGSKRMNELVKQAVCLSHDRTVVLHTIEER
jgi:hypothetical protein